MASTPNSARSCFPEQASPSAKTLFQFSSLRVNCLRELAVRIIKRRDTGRSLFRWHALLDLLRERLDLLPRDLPLTNQHND
jgi:hypothetical protein